MLLTVKPKEPHEVLVERLEKLLPYGAQERISALAGVSSETLSRWRNGRRKPNPDLDTLTRLSRAMGCDVIDLLAYPTQLATPTYTPPPAGWERFIKLPKVAWAAAGEPLVRIDDHTAFYAFHRDWITRVRGKGLDENRLVVVQVDKGALGESMLPTIRPGALLVVDRGPHGQGWPDVRDLKPAGLYVVRPDEEGLTVKRIFRDGEHLLLMPDNPDRERFQPRLVPLKGRRLQHLIVGRVRWIGHEED